MCFNLIEKEQKQGFFIMNFILRTLEILDIACLKLLWISLREQRL